MKILLAVDLREDPAPLVAIAAPWAARLGGHLHLVYTEGYATAASFIQDPVVRGLMAEETERFRARDRAALAALLAAVPADTRGEGHLLGGDPADAITAMMADFDLLILGTHGRTGLARMWLGSVTEKLLRSVQKPTLVLRLPTAG